MKWSTLLKIISVLINMSVTMRIITLTSILAMLIQNGSSAKILAIFMSPSYSHQIVYQPIWKELSLRGHQVTVITPNPLNDAKLTNLTEIDVSSSYKSFIEGNAEQLLAEASMYKEMKRFSVLYENTARHQLAHPEVQALLNNKNLTFDLLLVEYLYPAMYAFKDVFKCPMIGITSLGLTSLGNEFIGNPKNPALEPDMLLSFSVTRSLKERFTSAAMDLLTRWSSKLFLFSKIDKLVSQYIKHEIRPLYEICQEFSLVIVNSNHAIRNARPTVPNLIEISGIHIQSPKALPEDLKSFLDNSTEGVIYFSLGSNMRSSLIPQNKLNDIMQAFSEIPYKVLWKFEKDLPNKPNNVEIRKWLPQQDLLAHPNVKLFITQGGLQSIDEALFRKVPILLVPFFGDQEYNAHHMVQKGAALSLNYHKMTGREMKKSILEMMNNPKYQHRIDSLGAIASDQIVPALEKAVWWIEYVLRHDNTEHLKYSGRNVPFYQFYMLDIIAVTLLMIISISYAVLAMTRVLRKVFSFGSSLMRNTQEQMSRIITSKNSRSKLD